MRTWRQEAAASQTLSQFATKAQTYLSAGVEEVWLFDDDTRSIEVQTPHGTTTLDDAATLTSPLLPGFSVSVRLLLDGERAAWRLHEKRSARG